MKYGILCTMVNGFGRKGYYNTQEIGLGRAINRMGHTVIIYKCLMRGQQPETVELGENFTIHYLSVPCVGNAHGVLNPKVIDPTLDAILCFADTQLFLPHVYRYCHKHGIVFVPYIGTTYSLNVGTLKGRVSDFLLSIGSMRMYHRCRILAKTQGAMQQLKDLHFDDVTFAPVGLDDGVLRKDFREADVAALRRAHGLEKDDVVLLNVARLDPEKRPLELIALFDRIRDRKKFRLILIGEGALGEQLKAELQARRLEDRVQLISRVPYSDMWQYYAMSDYYVNFNQGEIFGMAIMEAVYYETSVAAVRAPGPSLTLQGMQGHRLCETDAAVEDWLCAPYPAQQLLRESSEKMLRDFSWVRTAREFMRLAGEETKTESR